MKKLIPVLLLTALLLSACGTRTKTADFNIISATDIHYISPTLHDDGEYFTRLINSADGSITAKWEKEEPMMGCYLFSIRSEFGQNYNYRSNEKNTNK